MAKSSMSGNISSSISDHLTQFFMLPEFISDSSPTKYNIISYDWDKFNNQSFLEDFENINWNEVLESNQDNINITFENYLNTMNALINSHAPLKELNKKQRKFQQKPWITKGIQDAIKRKNRLFKRNVKCSDCNKSVFY